MTPGAYLEMAEAETGHWWFLGRRAILADTLARLELPDGAEILEAGCGTGGNLAMLTGLGRVFAMELDERARAIAAERHGAEAEIVAGACPDRIGFPERRFDLICMFDVLEHIAEDLATLEAMRARLKPGGRLLISVPAYPWLWGVHDEYLHHQRRYTASGLKRLAGEAGYGVANLTYFNTLLFPLAALARLKDRIAKPAAATGAAMPSPLVNGLLASIFGFERHLLRAANLPFGVSLLATLTER
jgi:SAM-dependent methyltransferase